jgi:hypothetical protein
MQPVAELELDHDSLFRRSRNFPRSSRRPVCVRGRGRGAKQAFNRPRSGLQYTELDLSPRQLLGGQAMHKKLHRGQTERS